MTYTAVLCVVVVLVLVPLGVSVVMRHHRRVRPEADARARAQRVAEAALGAFREASAADPNLASEELRVRALMAASGESERQSRERVEKAKGISAPHATLQMLVVGVAARNERALVDAVGSAQLMKNIVEAQKTVMSLIPSDL